MGLRFWLIAKFENLPSTHPENLKKTQSLKNLELRVTPLKVERKVTNQERIQLMFFQIR
jgi:hypothetical protein